MKKCRNEGTVRTFGTLRLGAVEIPKKESIRRTRGLKFQREPKTCPRVLPARCFSRLFGTRCQKPPVFWDGHFGSLSSPRYLEPFWREVVFCKWLDGFLGLLLQYFLTGIVCLAHRQPFFKLNSSPQNVWPGHIGCHLCNHVGGRRMGSIHPNSSVVARWAISPSAGHFTANPQHTPKKKILIPEEGKRGGRQCFRFGIANRRGQYHAGLERSPNASP